MKNGIKAIAAALGFFVLYNAVTISYGLGMQLYFRLNHSELQISDPTAYTEQLTAFAEVNFMSRTLIQFFIFAILILILFRVRKKSFLTYIRWNPVSRQKYLLVAVMSIFLIVAIDFFCCVFMPEEMLQSTESYTNLVTGGGLFLNILLVVLIGPFVEELLLRGLIASRLIGQLPLSLAVAIPALTFGLAHDDAGWGWVMGAIMYTAIGLVYTLVYVWTNSLRTAVLAHMLNNLFAAFLPWGEIKTALPVPAQLLGGIACLSIAVFAALLLYKRWEKVVVAV